jgi:Alternative complex III, ActD subunit
MSPKTYGLIAMFDSPADIMHAAEKVRDAGYKFWDVITPFPIHGMDRAMGMRRSLVPRVSLAGGLLGFTTGMVLIWWSGAYNFKLTVGGKPLFSPLFAFPISYELTILFTAFATISGMFLLNRLPMHYHAVMKQAHYQRATDDRFFVVVEARDPHYDRAGTRALLEKLGGHDIAELDE